MARKTLHATALHVYGFRKHCSTALVSEVLRQSLHQAKVWGLELHIISCDISTAFDEIGHEVMLEAMLQQGVQPAVARAIVIEYINLRANVTVADAPTSTFFPFRRGGRQGGVETPELFNIIVEYALAEMIRDWTSRKLGFTLDERYYITHCVWADNFYLLAKTADEA
eukprot:10012892-Karenia_brevis.AAC.1